MLWRCAQGWAASHMAQQSVSSSVCVQVATWGMFPRPPDISKAYGGGRTLKPGQELESEDDRAARARRVTEVIPATRAHCQHTPAAASDMSPARRQPVAHRSCFETDASMCSRQHCVTSASAPEVMQAETHSWSDVMLMIC